MQLRQEAEGEQAAVEAGLAGRGEFQCFQVAQARCVLL